MISDKHNIILVGDIHGEFGLLGYNITTRFQHENAAIIQVGDFGLGFHKPNYYRTELTKLNSELLKGNNHLYVIRGNHDDPEYFKETNNPFDLSNITLLNDYSNLIVGSKHILLVGGAISIDRVGRLNQMDAYPDKKLYWPDEPFVFNEGVIAELTAGNVFDTVITHTAPSEARLFDTFHKIRGFLKQDDALEADLLLERAEVSKLYNAIKPAEWYFGHFHESRTSYVGATKFRCIDIDEHYQIP